MNKARLLVVDNEALNREISLEYWVIKPSLVLHTGVGGESARDIALARMLAGNAATVY